KWAAGSIAVRTEVCQAQRAAGSNQVQVVGARVQLLNTGTTAAAVSLYVALRPLGPAGGVVTSLGFSEVGDTLAANGYPAIAAEERAHAVGGAPDDTVGEWAMRGEVPPTKYPSSTNGTCSGALRYEVTLAP